MIDFFQQITKEAGNIVIRPSRSIIRKKQGAGNIVLDVDLESEDLIVSSIQRKYPDHSILSEGTHDQIKNPEQQKSLWIIDPLDGSTNAKQNIPFFAVSVAYMEEGIVIAGGIFDPNQQEFFWAEKGKGAFCNSQKLTVSDKKDIRESIIDVGSPYSDDNFSLTYPFGSNFHQKGARLVNFGSAALECSWVANGRIDAYFEVGLKPWDIAAAQLILSEAGGIMIDPYKMDKQFSLFSQGPILVGNPFIVNKLQKIIV
jgi:myo-inositol-1(or 4)-monophosphatase